MDFEKIVERLHAAKEYRPTCVGVIYRIRNGEPEFLLVQSAKNLSVWAFPQGGIEPGESQQEGLARELKEETGISPDDITNIFYDFHTDVKEIDRKEIRGFTKGKAYFFTLAKYIGNGTFVLQEEECRHAQWLSYDKAIDCLHPMKKKGLEKALQIIEQQSPQP